MGTKTAHPEVQSALMRAQEAGTDQAVVYHIRKQGVAHPPSAEEAKNLAQGLIDQAVKRSGFHPKRSTVFQNLGSMVVEGPPKLLLDILEQPEVSAATLNQPQGAPMELIRPVKKSAPGKKGWADK